MPKLINRNPKLSKLKKYAVSYYRGKIHYFGIHGTQEALIASNRFCAELQEHPIVSLPKAGKHVTVKELSAAFLDYAKSGIDKISIAVYPILETTHIARHICTSESKNDCIFPFCKKTKSGSAVLLLITVKSMQFAKLETLKIFVGFRIFLVRSIWSLMVFRQNRPD